VLNRRRSSRLSLRIIDWNLCIGYAVSADMLSRCRSPVEATGNGRGDAIGCLTASRSYAILPPLVRAAAVSRERRTFSMCPGAGGM
jgi:hypothetical protein